jgi:hypothetical protein
MPVRTVLSRAGIVPATSETKDNISKLPVGSNQPEGCRVVNLFSSFANAYMDTVFRVARGVRSWK